jgi:hypothetical protein
VTRLFTPILALHVVVAVLGLGSILSVALVSAASRRSERGLIDIASSLASLLRFSAVSLGVMLVTGILLDVAVRGAFHERWWFRGSAILLVLTGALHARARRTVTRSAGATTGREAVLRRIERLAYGMSVLIAAITVLMEVRPF